MLCSFVVRLVSRVHLKDGRGRAPKLRRAVLMRLTFRECRLCSAHDSMGSCLKRVFRFYIAMYLASTLRGRYTFTTARPFKWTPGHLRSHAKDCASVRK